MNNCIQMIKVLFLIYQPSYPDPKESIDRISISNALALEILQLLMWFYRTNNQFGLLKMCCHLFSKTTASTYVFMGNISSPVAKDKT